MGGRREGGRRERSREGGREGGREGEGALERFRNFHDTEDFEYKNLKLEILNLKDPSLVKEQPFEKLSSNKNFDEG